MPIRVPFTIPLKRKQALNCADGLRGCTTGARRNASNQGESDHTGSLISLQKRARVNFTQCRLLSNYLFLWKGSTPSLIAGSRGSSVAHLVLPQGSRTQVDEVPPRMIVRALFKKEAYEFEQAARD
jgi:hypothetical protein